MGKIMCILCLLIGLKAGAQTVDYPQGVYMSVGELLRKEPSLHAKLSIIVWNNIAKAGNGINDYDLLSEDGAVRNKAINKEIWGYSDGKDLYVNCRLCNLAKGYGKVLDAGKYLIFRAADKKTSNKQQAVSAVCYAFGGLFLGSAMFGTANGGLTPLEARPLYALDLSTGELLRVDPESIRPLLVPYSGLSDRFDRDWDDVHAALVEAVPAETGTKKVEARSKRIPKNREMERIIAETERRADSLLYGYMALLNRMNAMCVPVPDTVD